MRVARTSPRLSVKSLIEIAPIGAVHVDPKNPRRSDPSRMALLSLSLKKLGFIQPLFVTQDGMLLSGHQRTAVSTALGYRHVPVIRVDIPEHEIPGANLLFNRATNDFSAFDTGASAMGRLDLDTVLAAAEELPDQDIETSFAINCKDEVIAPVVSGESARYEKKAVMLATSVLKMGIKIPAVVSESGIIVNGIYRLFAALENGLHTWPIVRIPDAHAVVALNFLNYLSMDFAIDDDFKTLLRHSAYRRPQNNRGTVPKAYRFWANGERTLLDADSYTTEYWVNFRELHGNSIVDFGAGLCKVAPYLRGKGMNAIDFEPFRIDPSTDSGVPDAAHSRAEAKRFLDEIADPKRRIDSVFLASVLNSVPFPEDRLCVLAIVHALCDRNTAVYGTCRDISDFNYEYGGVRNANYFSLGTEEGVRLGDVARNPKIQKFETQESARAMFCRFWKTIEFWPGGNVFYFKLTAPMGFHAASLAKALEFEFDLPYKDGSTMGLGEYAKAAFSRRLMTKIK